MKRNLLALIMTVCLPVSTSAQSDDDMYFVPKKKKTEAKTVSRSSAKTSVREYVATGNVADSDTSSDYHTGQLRDVDEYNRRGSQQVKTRLVGDTLYVTSEDGSETAYADGGESQAERDYRDSEYYYDDDYYYATRLRRYHGVYFYDPFYSDLLYGWYDPWYYSWYSPWHSSWYGWYGPWYGGFGWSGGFSWGRHHHHPYHGSFGYGGRPYRSISHPVMRGGRTGGTQTLSGRGTPRWSRLDGSRSGSVSRGSRLDGNTGRSSGRLSRGSTYSSPSRQESSSPRGSSMSTPRGGSSVSSGSFGGGSRGSFGGGMGGSRGGAGGRSGGVRGR